MRSLVLRFLMVVSILVIAIFALFFGSLVKQVSAGCSGTIYCGAMRNLCSISHAGCNPNDVNACAGAGTCTWMCDETQAPMSCAGISSQWMCEQVGVKDCAIGCSINAERPCSWSGVGVPTPTPGGGGTEYVNCSSLAISGTKDGSGNLLKNSTYLLDAYYDTLGKAGNHIMNVIAGTNCGSYVFRPSTAGANGWSSWNWTPNATGTYTIYCGTSATAYAACSGYASCVAQEYSDYACGGPGAYTTVNVVDPTPPPSCTVTGPISVCVGASASYNVTSSNASSGSEIWKTPTNNQSWNRIRPPGGSGPPMPPTAQVQPLFLLPVRIMLSVMHTDPEASVAAILGHYQLAGATVGQVTY